MKISYEHDCTGSSRNATGDDPAGLSAAPDEARALSSLFPSEVLTIARTSDDAGARLLPEESAQMGWAVGSRLREFATTRVMARRALHLLGYSPVPILFDEHRAPIWPSDVVGSITHCSGFRWVAVARRKQVRSIGIDAEPNEALPCGLLNVVASPHEILQIERFDTTVHWDKCIFSAKESFYKAWYSERKKMLEFNEVEVVINPDQHVFRFEPTKHSSQELKLMCAVVKGRFRVASGLIVTTLVAQ